MDIVLLLHSFARYILLIVALAGVVVAVVALVQRRPPAKTDQVLASVFVGVYDLQMLLGLLIILLGGLSQTLLPGGQNPAIHPVVMFVGLVVAHGLQVMARRATGPRVWPMRLALYVLPLVVILVGLVYIGRVMT